MWGVYRTVSEFTQMKQYFSRIEYSENTMTDNTYYVNLDAKTGVYLGKREF